MLRSGRLLALDENAAQLTAAGLIRLGVEEQLDKTAGTPAWLGRMRAASFADAWLAFGDPPGPGLRVPAGPVLQSVVHQAAELLLQTRGGDGAAVLDCLGRQSAQAREQAHRTGAAHPAEPTALTMVWHGVHVVTADRRHTPPDTRVHGRHIDERYEAYVRERHRRQDTLALVLSCARIAATALVELSDGDPARAAGRLEEHAACYMPRGGPAPMWVPGRFGPPSD
ncbi:hypothetical protein KNE206_41950 [Kitasatospora sp. NE20-6]|uniref:hypothetical protein n=1 Tax=Kitasatospora sp. NE20-6 TaxID=2859066 RepID=UPI0034DC4086